MAKPFYSSGESFRVQHGFLSCYAEVEFSTTRSLLFDFFFPLRQVISGISDYKFGFATMHHDPSTIGKAPRLLDDPTFACKIFWNEYFIPITSEITEYLSSYSLISCVENTRCSKSYTCVFRLDYEQISSKYYPAFRNVNGINSSTYRKLLKT